MGSLLSRILYSSETVLVGQDLSKVCKIEIQLEECAGDQQLNSALNFLGCLYLPPKRALVTFIGK